jgi:hypothetical protein
MVQITLAGAVVLAVFHILVFQHTAILQMVRAEEPIHDQTDSGFVCGRASQPRSSTAELCIGMLQPNTTGEVRPESTIVIKMPMISCKRSLILIIVVSTTRRFGFLDRLVCSYLRIQFIVHFVHLSNPVRVKLNNFEKDQSTNRLRYSS